MIDGYSLLYVDRVSILMVSSLLILRNQFAKELILSPSNSRYD